MIGYILSAAFVLFIFWRIKRGKENAAEYAASGVRRTPLFWTAHILMFAALILSMCAVKYQHSESGQTLLLTSFAVFIAAIVARVALRRRHFV